MGYCSLAWNINTKISQAGTSIDEGAVMLNLDPTSQVSASDWGSPTCKKGLENSYLLLASVTKVSTKLSAVLSLSGNSSTIEGMHTS